jgi:hypothetical protein
MTPKNRPQNRPQETACKNHPKTGAKTRPQNPPPKTAPANRRPPPKQNGCATDPPGPDVWELELDLSRDQLPGRLLATAAAAFPGLVGVRIAGAYIGAGFRAWGACGAWGVRGLPFGGCLWGAAVFAAAFRGWLLWGCLSGAAVEAAAFPWAVMAVG